MEQTASLIFRKPEVGDARAILECHHAAIEAKALSFYEKDIIAEWAAPITGDLIKKVEKEITAPDWIYWVAEDKDQIIGMAIAVPSSHELRAVYVRPNSFGKIGERLLNHILADTRETGCVYLEADASINAEEFYTAHGFHVLSRGMHRLNSGQEMACIKIRIDLK